MKFIILGIAMVAVLVNLFRGLFQRESEWREFCRDHRRKR